MVARTVVTATQCSRDEAVERLNAYHAEVLSTNWADYLNLVYSSPFWEAEYERLHTMVGPYLHEKEVGDKWTKTQEMMDVLYQCEDLRDFLNELSEMKTRGSGFMGTGFKPAPKIENIDELAKDCATQYNHLLETHPAFKPKIEQTAGHGLAVLRSKHKFGFADGAPAGLREIGQEIAKMCVQKMLELECPNLLEHDQNRSIAYGHTWSPVYELTPKPVPMHHGHAISVDMAFSATWAAKEGWISEAVRDRVHAQFRRAGLSLHHDCFTTEKLHYGTKTILERRDGDLYAAVPNGQIGKCRFIGKKDFASRADMDASLEAALDLHRQLMAAEGGGVGTEPYITDGFNRTRKTVSKLELGTWAERMTEMLEEMKDSQSFETVKTKVAQITRWWDLTAEYLEKNSTKLGDAVQKVIKASTTENPFPAGMDMNWALDVQSAQTLDFFAGVQKGKVAWDLGTLTGVSAAVLSQHMKVTTVEREETLVKFARKHLPENVDVVQSEIEAFLQEKAAKGEKADFIFMDLDKPMYAGCYKLVMENGLLSPGGIMLCDNVLYRGLTAQHNAGEMPKVSEKTAANAASMDGFLGLVRADTAAKKVRSLMMPVRDGMLALQMPQAASAAPQIANKGYPVQA